MNPFRRGRLSILLLCLLALTSAPCGAVGAGWLNYGGDKAGTRCWYLRPIRRGNVRQLQVAWTYPAGWDHFTNAQGYPAIKPPWGSLTAIDLNRGEPAWQVRSPFVSIRLSAGRCRTIKPIDRERPVWNRSGSQKRGA